ncbi:hypothetical protein [Leptolyngbya sp. PCC 6406]|uniref:hypothetical protein n=1 Tax=Leptolyngbya sp. PCC 6406 TaxID=1173264 RepID=UPI0002ABA282|nr:hypothetical protein [Leptolyngbya sp. PCC 6406]
MGSRFRPGLVIALAAIALALTLGLAQAQVRPAVPGDRPPTLVNVLRTRAVETRPDATGFSLWPAGPNLRHEVWYRIVGGDALFDQRLRVFKENAPPRPINELPPPSQQVDEIYSNEATGWRYLGFESRFFTYYFAGDHRRPDNGGWSLAYGAEAYRAVYENGDLYDIRFEDQTALDDYNDLEIEVIMIRRHRFPGLPLSR